MSKTDARRVLLADAELQRAALAQQLRQSWREQLRLCGVVDTASGQALTERLNVLRVAAIAGHVDTSAVESVASSVRGVNGVPGVRLATEVEHAEREVVSSLVKAKQTALLREAVYATLLAMDLRVEEHVDASGRVTVRGHGSARRPQRAGSPWATSSRSRSRCAGRRCPTATRARRRATARPATDDGPGAANRAQLASGSGGD